MLRVLALVIVAIVLLGATSGMAERTSGAPLDMQKVFEKYTNYHYSDTGEWYAHDLITAQLLRSIMAGSARSHMSAGACIIYPQVRGDSPLGLYEIVLNVCLLKRQPLGADNISILVDGTRYDFITTAKKDLIGSYALERFELALDKQGIDMLHAMVEGQFAISINAGNKHYRTVVSSNLEKPNAKQVFEAQSIDCIRSLYESIDGVRLRDYNLWDMNECRWADNRPKSSSVHIDEIPLVCGAPAVDDSFRYLLASNRTAVKNAQQLLLLKGFYSGKIDGAIGSNTRSSIREAQRYYGLLQTGQADSVLFHALMRESQLKHNDKIVPSSVSIEQDMQTDASLNISYRVEGIAQIRIERYWFAHKIMPLDAMSKMEAIVEKQSSQFNETAERSNDIESANDRAAIMPTNAENVLCILDGYMTNLSNQNVFLPISAHAELVIDDRFIYVCNIRTVHSGFFGTQLLPLEEARIIVYAELPRIVMKNYKVRISIHAENGQIALVYKA